VLDPTREISEKVGILKAEATGLTMGGPSRSVSRTVEKLGCLLSSASVFAFRKLRLAVADWR
jgi:hypothetical protein